MSAIGRIFLILNLVLAAVFLGFAANQLSQNANVAESLRVEKAAHETTKKSTSDQISALTTQVNQLRTDLSTAKDERDQNKATADRNQADLTQEKTANAQMRGELTGIKESLSGYNTTITSLTSQKDTLVKEKEDAFAARDKAEADKTKADAARREAEGSFEKAKNDIDGLEREKTALAKKASATETELKQLYVATGHPQIGTPQPLIEGAVLSVNNAIAPGLLAINKGTNDKVTRGMVFDIYSGGVYKGQAKVEVVHDAYCSALVTLAVKDAQIAQGDRVTTQI